MKVLICTERDKNFESYITQAQGSGHDVYVDEAKGEYFIKIGEDRVWRAPDAIFRRMPSGTYIFDKDGTPLLVT